METPPSERRRAALARDLALRRVRRVTKVSIALMVALGSVFAALAAGSTHTKKTVLRATSKRVPPIIAEAPAPPLVPVQSTAAAPPAQVTTPAPPVAAPTPTPQAPVVVSGGS
jgi:hypothetical protein